MFYGAYIYRQMGLSSAIYDWEISINDRETLVPVDEYHILLEK
jgi:hypothetical protein